MARTQDAQDTLGYFAGVGYSPEFGGSFAFSGMGMTGNQLTMELRREAETIVKNKTGNRFSAVHFGAEVDAA